MYPPFSGKLRAVPDLCEKAYYALFAVVTKALLKSISKHILEYQMANLGQYVISHHISIFALDWTLVELKAKNILAVMD